MAKINLLDPSVFNMIAAGEVVERPASVVKELVENSIDAGATQIDITIFDGGLKRIQVSDNGIGIEHDDVRTAFLPHATSKLQYIRDLDTLSSLGFRGEALASIASVSEVTLVTRSNKEEMASYLHLVAGKVEEERVDSRAKGTSITVDNLFFNTPARLKFMKAPSAEQKAIVSTVEKIVFANPEISITISDAKGIIFEHQGGNLKDAICSIWGSDTFENMLEVDYEKAGISVKGYASRVEYSKPTRSWQAYIVNGRTVENKDLSIAVDKAYDGRLVKHNYAFCVLEIILPFDEVDVNVHPRKSEVRFRNKSSVFSAIYHGLNKAFDSVDPMVNTSFIREDNRTYGEIMSGQNNSGADFGYRITNPFYKKEESKQETEQIRMDTSSLVDFARRSYPKIEEPDKIEEVDLENHVHIIGSFDDDPYYSYYMSPEDLANKLALADGGVFDGKIVGQIFDTYLIVEKGGDVFIIDQHAAHERILYDKLSKRLTAKYIQTLLIPYRFKLSGEESEYFEKIMPVLNGMGFEINKKFEQYIIYAVPDVVVDMDVKKFMGEIFKNMLTDKEITLLDIVKEKVCQMACKSAIKGGDSLTPGQVQATVMSFLDKDGKLPEKCPHGRPAVIKLSKTELEKMFKRIV